MLRLYREFVRFDASDVEKIVDHRLELLDIV